MAFLRLGTIFKYLNATPDSRCVIEGEEVLFAKQLIKCGLGNVEDCKYEIIALCLQTSALADKPHELKGQLLVKEGVVEVNNFICSCKAGLSGVCKHVSACLFYCSRNDIQDMEKLTTTDLECYWTKNKGSVEENYRPTPISQYACIKDVKKCKPLTAEQQKHCLKILRENQPKSILYKHFSKTCGGNASSDNDGISGASGSSSSTTTTIQRRVDALSGPIQNIVENAENSTFFAKLNISMDNLSLKPCCNDLLKMLSMQNRQAAITVSQGSDKWKELRQLRITGSTCYPIYTYGSSDWEKKAKWLFFPKPFKCVYTEHGKNYEKFGLLKYKQTCGADCDVVELGFLISHLNPWLGFSPDAVVMRNGHPIKLVEIKCPYSGITEDATEFGKSCKYIQSVGENFILRKKHGYYGQVQLGLALFNLKECDFILYSSKSESFLKIIVKFDEIFAKKLIEKISFNYFNYIIHYACKKK